MARNQVSRGVVVAAPARLIFDIIASPARHAELDGSGSVRRPLEAPERLTLGSEFGMAMRLGVSYRMRNRVVEYEEGRLIAWRHLGTHRWRWELTELGDGTTRVTETFDYSRRFVFLYQLAGWPMRNARAIEATLPRLKRLAEAEAAAHLPP